MINKYNPKKVTGSWKGIEFLGYMDGTFIEVEYEEDAVTAHVGSQGDVTYVLNANQLAKATITLILGSPTNDDLDAQVPDANANRLPTGDFQLKDPNGTFIVTSKDAVIMKKPKAEFSKSVTGRAWTFLLPQAQIKNDPGSI